MRGLKTFQRRRGSNVRPAEMTASCAAAAAVAAAVKAFSAGQPRSQNEFSRTKPGGDTKPLDPKNFCKDPSKQQTQPCPETRPVGRGAEQSDSAEMGAGAGNGGLTETGADAGGASGAGADAGGASGAGADAGGASGAGADEGVLNIKAHICINFDMEDSSQVDGTNVEGQNVCVPEKQQSLGSQRSQSQVPKPSPKLSQQSQPPSQLQSPTLQQSQQSQPPSQLQSPTLQQSQQSQRPPSQLQSPTLQQSQQSQRPPSQLQSPTLQQSQQSQAAPSQTQMPSLHSSQHSQAPQSQVEMPSQQPSRLGRPPKTRTVDKGGKATDIGKESGQELAVARDQMAKQDKVPFSAGSCVCDGKVTPANASFKARTPRFSSENPDTRPWYCNTPNFHDVNLPKTPLNPTPPHAPFYQSAARFAVNKPSFKSPAPNAYLPPHISKTRWSGILTGYHGVPTCFNIIDRNCDLSTVHMHCVMCPPRGVYNKSIGLPLHEIYPDDKQRDEQLRHMCTWHTGEVKRAYHDRGSLLRGCTDGLEGRANVGPSGFRTDNVGCSCTRREDLLDILDDAMLEKMSVALNRKKRDPDLHTPSAVCQKFETEELASPEGTAAERYKKALDKAEECKKRCAEYKKMKKELDAKAAEDKQSDVAVTKSTPSSWTASQKKQSGTTESRSSRTSRIGEPAEPRLESVTECGEECQTQADSERYEESTTQDFTSKKSSEMVSKISSTAVSKKSSGMVSRKSSGGVSKKSSGVVSKKSSGVVSKKSSGMLPKVPSAVVDKKSSLVEKKSSGRLSKTASGPPSGIASARSSRAVSIKSSKVTIEKSEVTTGESRDICLDDREYGTVSEKTPGESSSAGYPETIPENSPEEKGSLQEPGSDTLPYTAPSKISGTSLKAAPIAGVDECLTGTRHPSTGTIGQDEINRQSVAANALEGASRQSVGITAQRSSVPRDGKSKPGECRPITFECDCALFSKSALDKAHPPTSQSSAGPQYGEQNAPQFSQQSLQPNYGAQGQQYGSQGQQYGAQDQQYGAQGQQCRAQSQQYGAQGQQNGAQGQQNGAQGQQYGAQGQQYGMQGQQYGAQGQQYGTQGQQYSAQAQQYGTQGQPGPPCGTRVKLCLAPSGQSAGTNTQQNGPQGQQYGPQGQQNGSQGQQYDSQGRINPNPQSRPGG